MKRKELFITMQSIYHSLKPTTQEQKPLTATPFCLVD